MHLSLTSTTFPLYLLLSITSATAAAAHNLPPPPTHPDHPTPTTPAPPCPTTLYVPQRLDCGGCYSTLYPNTSTKSVDCGGCKSLTTETQYNFLVGVCPVCIEGVQTRFNSTGTSTVTSCSITTTSIPRPVGYGDEEAKAAEA